MGRSSYSFPIPEALHIDTFKSEEIHTHTCAGMANKFPNLFVHSTCTIQHTFAMKEMNKRKTINKIHFDRNDSI